MSAAVTSPKPMGSGPIVQAVIEALDAGWMAPGQRLVEADLCLSYGVGRSIAREALQRLAARGVVEISRNKGARIREIGVAEAVGILQITELLTGLAARTAAARIDSPGAAARMQAALDELAATAAEPDDRPFSKARRHFYEALLTIGDNPELQRIFPTVQVHVVRAQFNLTRFQRSRIEDYNDIGRAVLAGAPDEAETAARVHVRRVRAPLEAML